MKKGLSNKYLKIIISLVLVIAVISVSLFIKTGKKSSAGSVSQTILTNQDYNVTATDISSSECKIAFNTNKTANYVIIHYTVNGGVQENVYMTGSGTNWTYSVKDLSNKSSIKCFFTYTKDGLQYDSTSVSYTLGSGITSNTSSSSSIQNTASPTATSSSSSNVSSSDVPALRTDIAKKNGQMFFQFNNKTNGAYADSDIYWCILGFHPSTGKLCYVNSNGQLIEATTALNTISKGDRKCANIFYKLSEKNYVYMPNIVSGRMYISYGSPVYVTINSDINGNVGFAGPDLNNTSDPNQDVYFEFVEFTIINGEYWGNTTRVDFFSFPVVSRLVGSGGYISSPGDANTYDKTVGDIGTRNEIFSAFSSEVPTEFKSLVQDKYRIVAPCKDSFNEGQINGNYFDNYINQIWSKYTNEDLVFTCQAGTFKGRVNGNSIIFSKDGGASNIVVKKPTTQDVLEGKGTLAAGSDIEKVVEAQLCAAINRGVALTPNKWSDSSAFYKSSPANFYSGFWHKHSINGLAYGFCYDDVFDYSTLLHYTKPTALVLDLKW